MGQYLPVVALIVLAALFAALSLVASKLLAPRRSTVAKRAPYECGIVPGREAPERFPVRFYLVAMIFIVFDIEIIFLYPWAVNYRNLGSFGLVEVLLFGGAVVVSLLYLVSKGALEWGPVKQLTRQSPMISAERTSATTIRRVGLEGRLPDDAPPPPPPGGDKEVAA
jgi:NADH-quinone oxidoreductase subunit A